MTHHYHKKDFPWTFYFNGAPMPKWGANWSLFAPDNLSHWEWDIGPRDLHLIRNKIDRVGSIESASAHSFLYAVQEVLCILFTERTAALDRIENWTEKRAPEPVEPREIYEGLVEAAFEMRASARREYQAFWTSGYEEDRLRLVEAMRRAALPLNDKEHVPPPHILARQKHVERLWKDQIKVLHQAGASKNIPQAYRKKLLEL
jgi:hypothetical protein